MELLSYTGDVAWPAVLLALARMLVPRVTALLMLALVLRGSRPHHRPRLLTWFSDCLPYWIITPAFRHPLRSRCRSTRTGDEE